jgi:serine/threonine protein kinase
MIGFDGHEAPDGCKGLATPAPDIYSLGATLHHLLTRRDPRLEPPFSYHKRPIREANPEESAQFEAVVMRPLAYSPEDRCSSAEAMKQALEACG